ncbi:MAG: Gfo/Idh/MocA family oxidoreductase [Clostridiales bacterium]|nr:Gfo/Idh/MocA family oxidoreductase [Clostridiales bacterium]
MMQEIRIGLVGAGWMGKDHSVSIANALMLFGPDMGKPIYEMVADVNEANARQACEKLGYKRWTTDWIELVQDPAIDLVDICTPNHLHYIVAKAALENSKHIFCEKPLSISAAESRELAELAAERNVVNYVGFNNLLNPATAYIRSLIQSGRLGQIVRFTGTYDQDMLLDPQLPISWRHINKFSGSGALGDLGSHLFSISQALMGDITAVNAVQRTVIKERPKTAGSSEMATVENDDVIQILAEYKNGAIGTLGTSRIATGRKNYLQFEIQGTQGSVHYNLEKMMEVNVYFKSDDPADRGYRTVLLNPEHKGYGTFFGAGGIAISFNDMKVLEFQELFAAVLKGEPYLSDFEFGYHVDRTISACIASAKSGQWSGLKTEEN